jgi:hypothetical protein
VATGNEECSALPSSSSPDSNSKSDERGSPGAANARAHVRRVTCETLVLVSEVLAVATARMQKRDADLWTVPRLTVAMDGSGTGSW